MKTWKQSKTNNTRDFYGSSERVANTPSMCGIKKKKARYLPSKQISIRQMEEIFSRAFEIMRKPHRMVSPHPTPISNVDSLVVESSRKEVYDAIKH